MRLWNDKSVITSGIEYKQDTSKIWSTRYKLLSCAPNIVCIRQRSMSSVSEPSPTEYVGNLTATV